MLCRNHFVRCQDADIAESGSWKISQAVYVSRGVRSRRYNLAIILLALSLLLVNRLRSHGAAASLSISRRRQECSDIIGASMLDNMGNNPKGKYPKPR